MTPEELRALAGEATPGPWEVGVRYPESVTFRFGSTAFHTRAHSKADARLIALAPQLARLCAEMGEAVEALWITRIVTGETAVVNTRELTNLHKSFRALSSLEALEKLQ